MKTMTMKTMKTMKTLTKLWMLWVVAIVLTASAHGQGFGFGVIPPVSSSGFPAGPNGCPQLSNTSTFQCQTNTVVLFPSGDDDTAQIVAAITAVGSGGHIILNTGTFVVGTGCSGDLFTLSSPITVEGAGTGETTLDNHCANHNLFDITYQVAVSGFTPSGAVIRNFQIKQNSGVAATAGSAFLVGTGNNTNIVAGLHIENILMNNLFQGIYVQTGVISNWFQNNYFANFTSGGACIVVNSASPSGDSHFDDNECTGSNTGVKILQADTFEITNQKVNGSPITVQGNVIGLRLINPSVEGGSSAIILNSSGGTVNSVKIVGGECGFSCQGVQATGVVGLSIDGLAFRQATQGVVLSGGITRLSINFDAAGIAVSMTNSAQATIVNSIIHQNLSMSGTYFVQTDSSITSGLVMSGNVSSLANNLNAASLVAANQIEVAGAVLAGTWQGTPVATAYIANNAVGSPQMAVVNTRRTACFILGANNASSALADADLGPQSRQYFINAPSTLVEVEVAADAGTPQIILGRSRAGSIVNLTSGALATASSGGIACSNTGGTTGIDGATTCSSTLQNTGFNAGDWITLVSGTAGGTANELTACATFTVN